METRLWPTVDHLDPPDLPRHGCNSDRGPAASGGPTVLANDRNGGRLRLNASRATMMMMREGWRGEGKEGRSVGREEVEGKGRGKGKTGRRIVLADYTPV